MNNLLLLAGLVLVGCLMNSKDLMNSDLVKSVSSKSKSVSKSLGVDNSTLLVVVFVGVVLFMCMNKSIEGFVSVVEGENCVTGNMHMVQLVDSETKEPTHNAVPGCFNPEEEKVLIRSPLNINSTTKPSGTGGAPAARVIPQLMNPAVAAKADRLAATIDDIGRVGR
jgi:hypothetical protein